jgi:3-oxoacyl-[acyl-carrier protein] reductase
VKSVFITGASRGLGRAIALAYAARGYRIGIGARTSSGSETLTAVKGLGGEASVHRFDVGNYDEVERALTEFGAMDVMVVNAAIAVTGLFTLAEPDAFRNLIDTNVLGPLYCARAALPRFLEQRAGLFVFVGSVAASRPARGQAAYAASKASVEALTRAIAVEYGRKGIRAVCIRPGAVATDMLRPTQALDERAITERIPMRRVAEPEEIARFVTTMDDAMYLNGAVLDIDGGYVAG